ncbi:fimbria/pilus outer membrane usher protein [Xylophilus sp. Kf1]|nr:fimbria/pilus outer membrane usher protein [Xylophilus sp. Kf1]
MRPTGAAFAVPALALGLWAAVFAPMPVAAASGPESLLAVRLNGVETGETVMVLRGPDGHPLVRATDLQRWRLPLPAAAPLRQDGEAFHRLDDLPGVRWRIDDARQALAVEAEAGLFDRTRLDLAVRDVAVAAPVSPGLLLNYDLSTAYAGRQRQTGALLSLGAFHRLGSGLANLVVRDGFAAGPRLLRLDTGWTLDLPSRRASLRLGDTVGGSGQWGRAVRLGGLQWATNFATQPGLVRFPLPSMAGETALPSTVDLYVNGALQLRREVPAGPFSLQQMPAVTGQGEVQLVVRDLLGREQRIVAPYFATPRLLQPGLHDFSYEAGRVREYFGLASNHYGPAAVFGTHRLGLSDHVTVEARGEWLGSLRVGGVGAVAWWPGLGIVSAALAASRGGSAAGRGGQLLALGAEHQAREFGFGVNTQFTSRGFEQAGQLPGRLALRQNLQAFAHAGMGGGAVSVAWLAQAPRDQAAVRLLSMSYSVGLGSLGFLGVTLLRSQGGRGHWLASLTLTRPLDGRITTSAGAVLREGSVQAQVQAQRNPPAGDGAGYRMVAAGGDHPHLSMAGSVRHAAGTAGLEADLTRDLTAVRAGASGGLAWIDGGLYASPRIDESFAVVEVPGQSGVGVYVDHQLVARTAADGKALLPRLRAYQRNPLHIEQADLALDSQIDSLRIEAVPAYRAGMVMRFPVRRSRSATMTVRQADGQPVPAGAIARIDGLPRTFPFGADGQLFLQGLPTTGRVAVEWGGGRGDAARRCGFELALPPGVDPLPDLGVLACLRDAP